MTYREAMYHALTQLGWGYVFLYFDFNLGTISVTPAWAGYLLFYRALDMLTEERRDLALLRPFAVLLGLCAGAEWAIKIFGGDLGGYIPGLSLITGAVTLYFHFQLFTDLAAIAAKYQSEGEELDRRFLRWRTLHALLITLTHLWVYLPWESVRNGGVLVLLLVTLAVMACLTACIFALRRRFKPEEAPPAAPTEPTE